MRGVEARNDGGRKPVEMLQHAIRLDWAPPHGTAFGSATGRRLVHARAFGRDRGRGPGAARSEDRTGRPEALHSPPHPEANSWSSDGRSRRGPRSAARTRPPRSMSTLPPRTTGRTPLSSSNRLGDPPSVFVANGFDARPQDFLVEDRRRRIIGVLDQQFGRTDRQSIGKAIAVDLLDRRVHDDGKRTLRAGAGNDSIAPRTSASRDPGRASSPALVRRSPRKRRAFHPLPGVTEPGPTDVIRALSRYWSGRSVRRKTSSRSRDRMLL